MTTRRRNGHALRQFQTLYNLGAVGNLTDGQLLERFATDADETAELAFAALVERHQAMVWRVCLAVLRDEHGAEDAFQATFLVLVRKARTLWVRDSLGPWLYRVAHRTASCLRAAVARRRKLERLRAEGPTAPVVEAGALPADDLAATVHEELNRLPEKYRAPIVLCDLEGRTHQEAARILGWPIGTVKSRQSHGRERIRIRLARRGSGLAVAALVDSLRRTSVAAMPRSVPLSVVDLAMRQSSRWLTGTEASASALGLSRRVIRAMFWGRLEVVAAATLAVGIASGGAVVYTTGPQEAAREDRPSAATRAASEPQPEGAAPPVDLVARRLAARKAKAIYEIAKLTRELAEIAVEEYLELNYPREFNTVEREIELAESDLARAKDRISWAETMFKKGYLPRSRLVAEDLNFQKAKLALEQARGKMEVLEDYTKAKTIKELRNAVEKARFVEFARKLAWELERARETELER